nr:hypothetical protein [Tanacetum cinerariifolium]
MFIWDIINKVLIAFNSNLLCAFSSAVAGAIVVSTPSTTYVIGGREYLFDISKPLPLIKDQGRQVVPADYFINNHLEHRRHGSNIIESSKSSIQKRAVWGTYLWVRNDKDSMHMHATGNLHMMSTSKEELLRDDNVLYKFKVGDFLRLNLRDIKDMLLLLVRKKLSNLDVDDQYDLDSHKVGHGALKIKFKEIQASNNPFTPYSIHPSDLDDPHDDARPEGENSAKQHKSSEHGTYVFGESSADLYATDDDELPTKKVLQELVEEMSQTVGPEKIVLSLHKFPAVIFPDDDIEERTSIWIDKVVPNVEDVSLVNVVFDGAFGREEDADFVLGEGIRRGGLSGSHGSRREVKKMTVRMMNIVKVMTIYFGGSGLKKKIKRDIVKNLMMPDGDPINMLVVPDIYGGCPVFIGAILWKDEDLSQFSRPLILYRIMLSWKVFCSQILLGNMDFYNLVLLIQLNPAGDD